MSNAISDQINAIDVTALVVVLPCKNSATISKVFERCLIFARNKETFRVCLISSFRSHFEDPKQLALETSACEFFSSPSTRITIVRTGHLLHQADKQPRWIDVLASFSPLVSSRWKSCFLQVDELLCAIDEILQKEQRPKKRTMTLLGRNCKLKTVLEENYQPSFFARSMRAFSTVLQVFMLGHLAGIVFHSLAKLHKPWLLWQCDTLEPKSVEELLSLYNPYNFHHIAIAGYNTGVVHFGWKYPGKTVVKTIDTGKCIRTHSNKIDVDAGVTLKRTINKLNQVNRELYVLPNYSYISMGTIFFVPVHGSGSEVSTLGDTLAKVLLYDPQADCFLRVQRGDSRFQQYMYNTSCPLLVLRLSFSIREKTGYFVQRVDLKQPTAKQIFELFKDSSASNIELRKSQAANDWVEVSKYFTTANGKENILEFPRDSIGRLWDRLEENPITSYLFHSLVRRFGYHLELFLDEDQFPIFWNAHQQLPLSKIQLRFVRSDGITHSPVGEKDCISADLFMKRKNKNAFLTFMKEYLPDAKYNPGKHSM